MQGLSKGKLSHPQQLGTPKILGEQLAVGSPTKVILTLWGLAILIGEEVGSRRTQPESFLTSKRNGENTPEVLLQVRFFCFFFCGRSFWSF